MIAIIPARGGSKRIPKKNIKPFLGKPIIAYAIQAALNSDLFEEVMVSTDSEEIEEVAKKYGANIPFKRSEENSSDFATTASTLLEVIQGYERLSMDFKIACCIYPTAPFVTPQLLRESFQKFSDKNYDTLFPVLPFSSPIQRALKLEKDERVRMFQPEYLNSRSQDLEKAYHDSGQFYWFKTTVLKDKRRLWTSNSGGMVISEMQAHDIDNPEDWKIAEFKFKLLLDDPS